MKRKVFVGLFKALFIFVLIAPVGAAAYERHQVNRANRLLANVAPFECSSLSTPGKATGGAQCPQCMCDFCLSGWKYYWDCCWAYLDSGHDITDEYRFWCEDTYCQDRCTAIREYPWGNIVAIGDCHLLPYTCTRCW